MEQYGKPTEATYKFGEVVLKERILTLTGEKVERLPNVYVCCFTLPIVLGRTFLVR